MASAYGIIENHNGFITVESAIDVGSTFIIYLPLSAKSPQIEKQAETELSRGTGKIIIIDDEEMILEVGEAMLMELGYDVIIAQGGNRGVQIVEQEGKNIDLIILDLVMPGMDGEKTFHKIREYNKEVPVILASGYATDEITAQVLKEGCSGFIQKPFSMSELSQKVKAALN